MMTRQVRALGVAPDDADVLRDGPTFVGPVRLARVCSKDYDQPWYFDTSDEGRFNLIGISHGTCYLASDFVGAAREVLGPDYEAGDLVPLGWFDDRNYWVVDTTSVFDDAQVADLTDSRWASHQLTNEIFTTSDYALTQPWALRFYEADYGGLRHGLRHLPSLTRFGVSVFGPAGAAEDDARFMNVNPNVFTKRERDHFSEQTSIRVEGSPTPRLGLHIVR
jgi:RES domain